VAKSPTQTYREGERVMVKVKHHERPTALLPLPLHNRQDHRFFAARLLTTRCSALLCHIVIHHGKTEGVG